MAIPIEDTNRAARVDEFGSGTDPEKNESKLIRNGGDVVTPNSRPVRERKAADRYSISSLASWPSGSKPLSIVKGSGTPLKDIPNVAFKLLKRKPDDTLQLLHRILFGKRAKAHNLKKNIGQFSGFVWEENEEKQRAKMKEKLDNCVKDKLVDFCDVLNIPFSKFALKKEDLLIKLLEFLESPHATTEVLLADKEQKNKKQKRSATSSRSRSSKKASGENSAKKTQSMEKRKRSSTNKENESDDVDDKMSGQSHSLGEKDDASEKQDSDQEQTNSDAEKDGVKDNKTTPNSSSKDNSEEKKSGPMKTEDRPKKSRSAMKVADTSGKSSSKKRQKVDKETKHRKSVFADKSSSKKQTSKPADSVGGEEETNEEDKVEPTKEELHAVAVNILKEVDFNTATLSDILQLLGSRFGSDLKHRKSEVKAIIQEVIESMSNGDSDEEGEDDNDDLEK